MTDSAAVDRFMENAAKAAARVFRASDNEDLNRIVKEALGPDDSVFCPRQTDNERALGLPAEQVVEDYLLASACVQEVFGGIAETGSLICSSSGGKTVQAGLLPPHHIAIVSSDHIYNTLDDFFAEIGTDPPTNITFETGPSRTADIELTLTIGVHGPERLTIVVV